MRTNRSSPDSATFPAHEQAARIAELTSLFSGRAALSSKEASAALDLGTTNIYRMIGDWVLPAIKVGRRTLIPVAGLLDWLGSRPAFAKEDN